MPARPWSSGAVDRHPLGYLGVQQLPIQREFQQQTWDELTQRMQLPPGELQRMLSLHALTGAGTPLRLIAMSPQSPLCLSVFSCVYTKTQIQCDR